MQSSTLLDDFRSNGWAVTAQVFSPAELNRIDESVRAYVRSFTPGVKSKDLVWDLDGKSLRCAFRLNEHSPLFTDLMKDARLIEIVTTLFDGVDPVPDGVMLIDKAPHTDYEFPWHQDNAYQCWSPPDGVALTLALDDSDADSGAITCLAGSHRLGLQTHQPSGVSGASRGIVELPPSGRFPERVLDLKRGEIGLHHVNTIHRTGPNRTGAHRRNLGFAYHSTAVTRNQAAFAAYEEALRVASAK